MEVRGKKRKVSLLCLQLLALLQITSPSSAQTSNTTTSTTSTTSTTTLTTFTTLTLAALGFRTRPADVTVAVGEPAVFRCGVPEASPNVIFTFLRSHANYSLTCPSGHMEDIPQALYGSCERKNGESLAVWTLKGTSFSDNGTTVVCQQPRNPKATSAVLYVYDTGTSKAILIGCAIGGFFGMLLVFGLSFTVLRRSKTLHKCFWGGETHDDMSTMVTKE
ncbi:uncharacterized protein [Clinocottus analis]|uniref:uncharacterized protein n=1 Tax=Clinocottus analis TaxID=304258 RepID=UPI0035C12CD8